MRIRYTTWTMTAVLLCSAAAAYGTALPKSGSGDSGTASTAKAAPKKPAATSAAAGSHTAKTSAARHRIARPAVAHAQLAPAPSRISEIQSALAREGAYQGMPNGRWDSDSIDAMKHFQTKHDLNPSGKIDALTLQKLGLGSQVSGMGAPIPVSEPEASAAGAHGQTERP